MKDEFITQEQRIQMEARMDELEVNFKRLHKARVCVSRIRLLMAAIGGMLISLAIDALMTGKTLFGVLALCAGAFLIWESWE